VPEYVGLYVIYDIYCNWVSTRWLWSVNVCKSRKKDSYIQMEKQYKNTEYAKIENKNTKQKYKHTKNI